MTIDSQSLAFQWRTASRRMLGRLSVTILLVSATVVSSGYATAQAPNNTGEADEQQSSSAIDRVLGTADVGVSEQPAFEAQDEAPNSPPLPLSELDLNRIPRPDEPSPPAVIDLSQLILIPNPTTVSWLDEQFDMEIGPINSRIAFRQDLLQQLLEDPSSNDDRIRQVQSILSQLRAERDRIAIEHLLLVRQVNGNGALPTQAANSGVE